MLHPEVPKNVPVLTVSKLTHAIKIQLESTFPEVWLQGEISNFKKQSSGHLYFSLKDSQAQISAAMFRGNALSLSHLPKDGDHVIVRGEISVYPPRGNYQLIVRKLFQVGLGQLLLKLEELKKTLKARGWFDPSIKKPLPKFPKKIGVVTSPTGAAIQDILNVLNRRFSGVHIILNPVKVQGQGAALEIAQAIEQFNRYQMVDVMIVGRGGGSIEDLWPFNEEVVAKAIFESQIPVISAVGHETDTSISDLVADVRAPTPSAAAEIVVAERAHQLELIKRLSDRLCQTMAHIIRQYRHQLEGVLKQQVVSNPYILLEPWMQKIDYYQEDLIKAMTHTVRQYRQKLEGFTKQPALSSPYALLEGRLKQLRQYRQDLTRAIKQRIGTIKLNLIAKQKQTYALKPLAKVGFYREKLDDYQKYLDRTIVYRLQKEKQKVVEIQESLKLVDPKNLLKKGYSIIFSEKEKSVISSVCQLKKNQQITLMFADGQADAQVIEVPKKDEK